MAEVTKAQVTESQEWLKDKWDTLPFGQRRNARTGEVLGAVAYQDAVRHHANIADTPIRPERDSLLDPSTGLLKQAYQFKGQTIDPTKLEGYSAYKTDALRSGPSTWANLAKQKQQAEQSQAFDQANQDVMAGNAQARSGLAMRGGLSAGARERLAGQMQKELATGRQKVAGQGILARANIDLQDEQSRQSMLGNFMNTEGQLARYNTDIGNQGQQFNILQALQENARGDDFKMKQYEEQMKKWAADRQARATENSGGGGGK